MNSKSHDITVVVPSIPPRAAYLERALASITAQTYAAADVIVRMDLEKEGAPLNRHRALQQVTTDWVAFLDDDDWFKPGHLDCLVAAQQQSDADYVYSWYEVVGGTDPLPHFGKPFDHCDPHQTTITTMVRTELAQDIGFVHPLNDDERTPDGNTYGEDYSFTVRCVEAGAYIFHTPYKTWYWHHHGANTSGRPDRWSIAGERYVSVVFNRR